jgi:hypothetical protein
MAFLPKLPNHDIIAQVRELLERHWDTLEISAKMNIDADVVQMAIDIIQGIV